MGKFPGLMLRGPVFHYRKRVPEAVRNCIASNPERWKRLSLNPGAPFYEWRGLLQEDGTVRAEIVRSLKTGTRREAERRYAATLKLFLDTFEEIVARMSAEEPVATDDHLRALASKYHSERIRAAEAEFGALSAHKSEIVQNWREDLAAIASGSDVFKRAFMKRAAGLLAMNGFVAEEHACDVLGGYLLSAERTLLEQQIWEWETKEGIWDRDEGPTAQPKVPTMFANAPAEPLAPVVKEQRSARRLTPMKTVYKLYVERKEDGQRHAKTISGYHYVWGLIEDCFDVDKPMSEITRDETSRFEGIIRRLPANWRKKRELRHLSVSEAAEEAVRRGMRPIAANTRYGYLSDLSAFFGWAEREDYIEKNVAQGLAEKPRGSKSPGRRIFEPDDLVSLFGPDYRKIARKYGGLRPPPLSPELPDDPRYWAPLVSLFTGMRLAEICQLTRKEVRDVGGIPCIVTMWDVGDDTDYDDQEEEKIVRSMKSTAALRAIPLVDELIHLGFWKLAQRLPEGDDRRLFPTLEPDKHGYVAAPVSRWFNRYKASIGILNRRKVFHSLRHTFRSAMARAEVSHDVAVRVGGWASRGLSDHYGRSDNLVKLAHEQLNRIRYEGLDLSHLHWQPDGSS